VTAVTSSATPDHQAEDGTQTRTGSPIYRTPGRVIAAVVVAAVAIIDRALIATIVSATVVVTMLPDILAAVIVPIAVLCVSGNAPEAQKGYSKDREHYAAS